MDSQEKYLLRNHSRTADLRFALEGKLLQNGTQPSRNSGPEASLGASGHSPQYLPDRNIGRFPAENPMTSDRKIE